MAGEIIRDIKRRFREGSVPARLLYVNVGVFLLVSVCRVVDWLFRLPPGGGAVFFLLSVAVFPVFREGQGPLLGASAAVLALIAAMGTAQPDYPVRLFLFGQIRMKYIAIGLILISFLSVPSANAGGEIAHLGGAFGGWLFACCLARGRDLTKWLNAERAERMGPQSAHAGAYGPRSAGLAGSVGCSPPGTGHAGRDTRKAQTLRIQ